MNKEEFNKKHKALTLELIDNIKSFAFKQNAPNALLKIKLEIKLESKGFRMCTNCTFNRIVKGLSISEQLDK
jgi:hypothetical protein